MALALPTSFLMDLSDRLAALWEASPFRSGIHLTAGERTDLQALGPAAMAERARPLIVARLGPATPPNDGPQTPCHGYPAPDPEHPTPNTQHPAPHYRVQRPRPAAVEGIHADRDEFPLVVRLQRPGRRPPASVSRELHPADRHADVSALQPARGDRPR